MKNPYVQHSLIGAGILAFGFLFWYFYFPAGDTSLTVPELRTLLAEGTTPEERAQGAAGLGERGDKDSIPLLFAAMEDDSVLVRARAGIAVKKILGSDFFFNPEDPPEKRGESLEKYKALWEAWKEKTGYRGE